MIPSAGARPPERRQLGTGSRDRVVTGLLVALLAVTAFAIGAPRVATPSPAGSGAPSELPSASPVAPVAYREGVVGGPASITPVTARTLADKDLVGLIFSGLVKEGPGDTLVPDLAASWSVDKSGRIWTITIRPDAVWQDGTPVTADDVVYTVSVLKDPSASGGLAAAWADVTAEALDSRTVRFTLGSPVGSFLAALTQPLLPAHLLKGIAMADLASSSFALNPVGSGPYQLVQMDASRAILVPTTSNRTGASHGPSGGSDGSGPGDPGSSAPSTPPATAGPPSAGPTASESTTASPNPSAVGARDARGGPIVLAAASVRPSASTRPSPSPSPTPTPSPTAAPDPNASPVEQIELDFYDTEAALAAAFTAGQIDGAAGLSAATTQALGALPGVRVLDYPTTTLAAVLLNLRPSHPELGDPNLRKALLGAIDRTTIVKSDLGGQARIADTLIPPESSAYDASRVVTVPYDRTKASALLRAAGWTRKGGRWAAPKGKAPYAIELLTVPADVNPRLAAIANAVKDDWTALGLTVTVTSLSGSDLAARLQSGDFAAAVLDIASGLEPDLYPLLDSSQVRANGSNRSGYQDPAMDKLLEAARQSGTSAKVQVAWSALLAGISAKMPVLPIVWADEQMVVRGLSGVTPRLIVHPGDRYWDVLAWRLAASR